MIKLLPALLALVIASPAYALEKVSEEDAPITVYQIEDDFGFARDMLKAAIAGQGLKITSTLHISDMYERTAGDLGLEKQLYNQAEAFEFCSIMLSYKMSSAHPANLAVCPLTIGMYQPAGEEDLIYVTFRNAKLLGDGAETEQELHDLLDGIVREAFE